MKTYEALLIFSGSLKEDVLDKSLKQIEDEIVKLNGNIGERNILGKRQMAHPIRKEDIGQYVKVAFIMSPESIVALRGRLKLNEDIFRLQITRIDADKKENEKEGTSAKKEESGG